MIGIRIESSGVILAMIGSKQGCSTELHNEWRAYAYARGSASIADTLVGNESRLIRASRFVPAVNINLKLPTIFVSHLACI